MKAENTCPYISKNLATNMPGDGLRSGSSLVKSITRKDAKTKAGDEFQQEG